MRKKQEIIHSDEIKKYVTNIFYHIFDNELAVSFSIINKWENSKVSSKLLAMKKWTT